jgi:hypothetical protein
VILTLATLTLVSACTDEPAPSPEPDRPTVLAIRGAYGRDASASGTDVMRSVGLNVVTTAPDRAALDRLQAQNMKGIVWLGSYNRAVTEPCDFERDDAWIRKSVNGVAGHPAIAAYQVSDEPDSSVAECPGTVEKIADRASLVRSIDPSAPTYVTISRTGATYERWSAIDVLGLVVYPVSIRGYNEEAIPKAIAAAESDGVDRYWAVLQDFGNGRWYVTPSDAELQHQFDQWATSRMDGYMIYHWSHADLDERPDHLAVISGMNHGARSATPVQPILSSS